jgi:hypothetical protein
MQHASDTPIGRVTEEAMVAISALVEDYNALIYLMSIQSYIGLASCELVARYGTPELRAMLRDQIDVSFRSQTNESMRTVLNVLVYAMAREFDAPDIVPESIRQSPPIRAPKQIKKHFETVRLSDTSTTTHITTNQIITLCGRSLGPESSVGQGDKSCKACFEAKRKATRWD